ncbi:hypothetical protein VTI74DRAFT_8442 [Chaetomium olivicolor]
MQPPPSPTRPSQNDNCPSASSSTPSLSSLPAPGNTTSAAAALQGATLAFKNNSQRKTGASSPNPHPGSNTGRGPSPARPPSRNVQTTAASAAGGRTRPATPAGVGHEAVGRGHGRTADTGHGNPIPAGTGQGVGSRGNGTTGTGQGRTGQPQQGLTAAGLRGNANGALLAATQAAREHAAAVSSSGPRPRSAEGQGNAAALSGQVTGGSGGGDGSTPETGQRPRSRGAQTHGGLVAQRLSELHPGGGAGGGRGSPSTLLSPPVLGGRPGLEGGRQGSSSSPSLIAATLAASRSASPVRMPSPQPSPNPQLNSGKMTRSRGQSVSGAGIAEPAVRLGAGTRAAEAEALDTASIPPTTSLVSLFESKRERDDVDPVKRRRPALKLRTAEAEEQTWMDGKLEDRRVVKPKPKPEPKPKPQSVDLGRPALPDLGQEYRRPLSQVGQTMTAGRNDEEAHVDLPPQSQIESRNTRPPLARKPRPQVDNRPLTPSSTRSPRISSTNLVSPQPKKLARMPRPEPPAPPARVTKMPEPTLTITPVEPEHDHIDALHSQQPPPRQRRLSQSSTSTDDTFVSASSVPSRSMSPNRGTSKPSEPSTTRKRASSLRSLSNPDLQHPPTQQGSTPTLPLDSLTNAIVASNLASSRLTINTPSQPPPVPAPRRSGRNHTHGTVSPLQPHHTAESLRSQLTGGSSKSHHRTPQQPLQPQRSGKLLQTLRSPHSPALSDDEDARRRMHHLHRKRNKVNKALLMGAKHAHHEGSRRRWRDEITARERRRYEAVWASNRGLFLREGWAFHHDPEGQDGPGTQPHFQIESSRAVTGPEADLVVNVVVRDIWARSRLPADELAEVWDLVDRGQRGALARDEFVVGMWLIDQRLRGRKIPARVSQSVWDSARGGGSGVVVPLPKGRKGK